MCVLERVKIVSCSVAHTTNYKSYNNHRYYTAHLVVLCVRPIYRVVYISNAIRLHRRVFQVAPMVRPLYIDDGFVFPVGLIVENDDSLVIGCHVNDHSSIIFRLKGLKKIMSRVLKIDQRLRPKHGPPLGSIQQYIHDILVNNTSVQLVHKH